MFDWFRRLAFRVARTNGAAGGCQGSVGSHSTSIPLNIAEGNGKYSLKDRCRFLDIARASALECAAVLDVLVAKRKLLPADIQPGKQRLQHIVRMLMGLIKRNLILILLLLLLLIPISPGSRAGARLGAGLRIGG